MGGTCLTLLLNERGTIEGEATLAKLAEDRFWVVTGASSERRVWDWMTVHRRGSEDVSVLDRSDDFGVLVYLELSAGDVDATGGEAVYRDGRLVGSVSSGGFGPGCGKSLAFAYVGPEAAAPGTALAVSVLGEHREARVLPEAVRDPGNHRLKAEEDENAVA